MWHVEEKLTKKKEKDLVLQILALSKILKNIKNL